MPTASGYANCSYELRHSSVTRSAFITFGVDPSGTDPVVVAGQLAAAFSVAGSLFTIIDSNVQLINTHVALGTDGGEDLVGANGTVVGCTYSGTSTPPQVSVLVHKRTARGGRRGRGRMYIPWALATSEASEAGIITGARQTTLGNAVNAWYTAVNGGAGPLVLLHRESADDVVHPTPPGPPNVITSMTIDPLVGTQRRRLGRS